MAEASRQHVPGKHDVDVIAVTKPCDRSTVAEGKVCKLLKLTGMAGLAHNIGIRTNVRLQKGI